MSRFKKIYVGCIIFFLFLTIVAHFVNDSIKKKMKAAIDKGTIIYHSQTVMMMAKDGNIKWFEQQDYLRENYDYQDRLKNSYIHEAIRHKRYELVSYKIKDLTEETMRGTIQSL